MSKEMTAHSGAWLAEARESVEVASILIENRRYSRSVFMAHQVIEAPLKAANVSFTGEIDEAAGATINEWPGVSIEEAAAQGKLAKQHGLKVLARDPRTRALISNDLYMRILQFWRSDPYFSSRYPRADGSRPSLTFDCVKAQVALALSRDALLWADRSQTWHSSSNA